MTVSVPDRAASFAADIFVSIPPRPKLAPFPANSNNDSSLAEAVGIN